MKKPLENYKSSKEEQIKAGTTMTSKERKDSVERYNTYEAGRDYGHKEATENQEKATNDLKRSIREDCRLRRGQPTKGSHFRYIVA